MSTDLTGAEIDAIQDRFATDGDPTHDDVWTLIDYARSISARLAAARQEGVREGIEMAAQWHDAQAVRYAGNRAQVDYLHREYASRIRSLSPAPAEPSAPVAPKDE